MTRAVATTPLRPAHRLLWLRVLAVNVAILVAAVLALVLTPATVSARPRASEVVVLAVGLVVTAVANAFVVRSMVRPLDELAARLDREGSFGTASRLPVEGDGIVARLSRAVNDLLERLEEGRRQAGVAALAAQESERARIAQELHDGVGQSLTVILLEAGALAGRSQVDPAELDRIRELARTSLDEVRGVARQLRPHVLEDLGLRSALSALTTELFGHGDTHVHGGSHRGCPTWRRRPSWSSSGWRRRHSPTSPGTPRRPRSRSGSRASVTGWSWWSPTTGSGSPTGPTGPGCAACGNGPPSSVPT